MPKVSVIIPVYNVENYIERCARSLFEQTLDDIEYIFVDDCTPDNSIDIIKSILQEFPNRQAQVTFVKHEKNKGLPAARNSGLEVAKGDYIAHCDSDDWVDINMYKELYLEAIAKNADIAICDIRMVFQNHSHVFKSIKYNPDKKQMLNEYLTLEWNCTVNMIVNSNIYKKYNIKSPKDICYCEDFHLTIRLLYHAQKIVKVDKPYYNYNRTNNSSITHKEFAPRLYDRCRCDLEIIQFFTDHGTLAEYIESMSQRILRYKQDWIFYPNRWNHIQNFYPNANLYLWSCPKIKFWRKIAFWCIIHNIYFIPKGLIFLRKGKHRIFNH